MTFWVEQLVRNKLDRADSNKKQGAKSLANGNTRDDNQVQSVTNKGSESSTQDVQRVRTPPNMRPRMFSIA